MKTLIITLFITVFLVSTAHGQTLSTTYHPSWNDYTAGVNGGELYNAGYPQFGQGQWTHNEGLKEEEKDPTVRYDIYYPTLTEMIQWAQALNGGMVTIYSVNRTSSFTFRAKVGNTTGKDGLYPSEAMSNLLLKLKGVPYYTTGGQILWFLYGQN